VTRAHTCVATAAHVAVSPHPTRSNCRLAALRPLGLIALALPCLAGGQATAQEDRAARLAERAHQDREIVYFLQEPESHSFSLYHDFTESRPGTDRYLNVVRRGSTASNPGAVLLDTGETLAVETLKGEAISRAGIDIGEPVQPDSEVVVVRYPPVPEGGSRRIRISETYTDPARYFLEGETFVWDRSFGRAHNAVVLPPGFYLTNSSIPATVSLTEDGRVRLDFVNPRPDSIAVLIEARRREPKRP
jgi:hypothetical protein